MKKPYLILDCNGLAYRAFHTTGGLTSRTDGEGTGTIYGFLGTVMHLEGRFRSNKFIFCFDVGDPKRMKAFPEYKKKRREDRKKWTDKLKIAHNDMHRQINLLRTKILKKLGFKNVWFAEGYEADDLIARACQRIGKHPAVIVTQDSDMYQLITNQISVFNPKTQMLWTKKVFIAQFGIKPKQWVQVKCLAGCGTDGIGNIPGIGEVTALKYVKGQLKAASVSGQKIASAEGQSIKKRNRPLVKLPMKSTPKFEIRKNKRKIKWLVVLDSLGMKSLNKRLRGLEE